MSESKAVADLRTLVRKYLDEIGLQYLRDSDEDFVVPLGPVMILVLPRAWGDDETVVMVGANVAEGVRVDASLFEYLNEQNAKLLFGKLVAYTDKSVVRVENPLLGDFLNRAELEAAIKVVGTVALRFKPEVTARWGGM